ncbi:MAG: DUF1802 family protein [Cyanophyceae cyanobacterium]
MLSATTHALKEWAIALRALESGDTILLLRKGGIREAGGRFQVRYQQVVLYPTYEHQQPHLLKTGYPVTSVTSGWHSNTVMIASWATITHLFCVSDESVVHQLLPYHIWNERFVTERFQWKPRQPLSVLLLRTYQLPQPVEIPYRQEYGGCQSWIDLAKPVSLAGSTPVLAEKAYLKHVNAIAEIVANSSEVMPKPGTE